jgi:ParB family transcriptional regulator, chromosome partitioning protein
MAEEVIDVPLDLVDVEPQIRDADDQSIPSLSENLKQNGLMHPVRVRPRPNSNRYVLITGHRRLGASRMAGWKTIPAIVDRRDLSAADILLLQLSENIARKGIKPISCGLAINRLKDMGLTEESIGQKLGGYSASWVSQILALLSSPENMQVQIESGAIPRSTANEILREAKDDPASQAQLLQQAAEGKLKRHQVKSAAKKLRSSTSCEAKRQPVPRIKAKSSCGLKVEISGRELTLENIIASAAEIQTIARSVQLDGGDLTTLEIRLKDQAKA